MSLDDMFHRWLDRIGSRVVHQGQLPETVRADRVIDDAFDTLPSTDERRLPAKPDPDLEPEYAAMLAKRGDFVQVGRLTGEQIPLLMDFIKFRQADTAALDMALAGLIDDADDFGEEAGR